jgi:hypothetical protein
MARAKAPAFDIIFRVTILVKSGLPHEHDLQALRARAIELEQSLQDRNEEIARIKAGLEAFRIRYRQDVGLLHEQLDELEQAIDEIELGVMTRRLEDHDAAVTGAAADSDPEPLPRLTSDAVRRLFRDVAKLIHPDLAPDADARGRRHSLMIEANKAYALGDEERLRRILQAWEDSPEAIQGDDEDAVRLRLVRRIAQIEEQLNVCAAQVAEMQATSLWTLKAMVDEEAAKGKDLIADMVRRLKRDILVAQNRLDAMRSTP